MKALISILLMISSLSVWAREAQIEFKFKYNQLKPGMEVYDLKEGSKLNAGKSGFSKKKDSLPLGAQLADSSIKLETNHKKRIVLVYQNSTDQEIHFFAVPPSFDPVENAIGFRLLGPADNKIYKVPAGSYWYRVIEFRLGPNFWGESVAITHQLVQVEPSKANTFSNMLTSDEDL